MAKTSKKTTKKLTVDERLFAKSSAMVVLMFVYWGLSYIFISLAIDSGFLLEWIVGLIFLGWGFNNLILLSYRGVHHFATR